MSNDNTQTTEAVQTSQPNTAQIDYKAQLDAVNEQLVALKNLVTQQSTVTETLAQRMAPKPQPIQEEYDPYNPEDYASKIASKAAEAARLAVAEENKKNLEKQAAINSLASDYPELSDSSSEFSKKLVALHSSLDKTLQGTAMGYKIAAREAAAELGVLPKGKRQSNDDFVMGGSGSSAARRTSKKESDISDSTLMAAELMGLNVKDEKVLKNLKSHAERFGQVNVSKYK